MTMVDLEKIGCMVWINGKRCGRPVQYVFEGTEGPFYRCGKCGRVLAARRNDVEVLEG